MSVDKSDCRDGVARLSRTLTNAQMLGRFLAATLAMGGLGLTVPASSQTIYTVAGGGTGDGGMATSASLGQPYSVALDASGNLYIADYHRIRKVAAATGIITTVAGIGVAGFDGDGGMATNASLSAPSSVALDGSGNLYVADQGNNRIRKVDAATGIITTVAGNGSPTFAGDGGAAISASIAPAAIRLDASRNLYVADASNSRVLKISAETGILITVAGDGSYSFAGDGGQAASAALWGPRDLAVDANGNLYIADVGNSRIRRIDAATGIINTVVGDGIRAFAGDGGPATSASLQLPYGVALDASGNFYIADTYNYRIRKVAASTGVIATVAGNGGGGFAGDGVAATSTSLDTPFGVALDASGHLYIADFGNQRIRQVNAATGIISTVAGTGSATFAGDGGAATNAALNSPIDLAFDANRNLYIADFLNHRIRKVAAGTGIITTVAGTGVPSYSGNGEAATNAGLSFPTAVALDASGNLFIADRSNQRIRKVAAATGIISTVAGTGTAGFAGDGAAATSARLSTPYGVAVDPDGNLYIGDSFNNRVRKVNAATGIISTAVGTGTAGFSGDGGAATNARLSNPRGIAFDANGNLYVADLGNNRIRKVAVGTGVITTVAGNGSFDFAGDGGPAANAALSNPPGVALDARGNLYIADNFNDRIRKVDAATGIINTVVGNGIRAFAGDGGPATSASLKIPQGVAVDARGNLYIADYDNHRIRKVIFYATRGDFTGDGKSDVLWRDHGAGGTGQNYLYPMNGTTILGSEGYLRTVANLAWQVVGIGDFDGDGRVDILWRNEDTGENYVYFMSGPSITSEGYLRTVSDVDWRIAGVGDFNGDGRDDILWRNASSGENYIYLMNGLSIVGEGYLRTVAELAWQIKGVGDFDGDGKADILWRNASSGQNYLYPMDGVTTKATEGFIRTVADSAWQIEAVGDFDGDGNADIAWRNNSSGENYVYLIQGTNIVGEGYLRTVADVAWQIVGSGDYDGDGKSDLLWRNAISGENYLYPMNGTSIKSTEGYLRPVAAGTWSVVNN